MAHISLSIRKNVSIQGIRPPAQLDQQLPVEMEKKNIPLPGETVSQRHCEGAKRPKQSDEVVARREATWRSQPQHDEIPRCARDDPKGRIASLPAVARPVLPALEIEGAEPGAVELRPALGADLHAGQKSRQPVFGVGDGFRAAVVPGQRNFSLTLCYNPLKIGQLHVYEGSQEKD